MTILDSDNCSLNIPKWSFYIGFFAEFFFIFFFFHFVVHCSLNSFAVFCDCSVCLFVCKTVVFVNAAFAGRVIVVYSCYFVGFAWIFVWFGVFSKKVHKLSTRTIEGVYFFYVCEMVFYVNGFGFNFLIFALLCFLVGINPSILLLAKYDRLIWFKYIVSALMCFGVFPMFFIALSAISGSS